MVNILNSFENCKFPKSKLESMIHLQEDSIWNKSE